MSQEDARADLVSFCFRQKAPLLFLELRLFVIDTRPRRSKHNSDFKFVIMYSIHIISCREYAARRMQRDKIFGDEREFVTAAGSSSWSPIQTSYPRRAYLIIFLVTEQRSMILCVLSALHCLLIRQLALLNSTLQNIPAASVIE